MARNWEAVLTTWSSPPSNTEQAKCANAETAVRKAVAGSAELAEHDVRVFAQGSYRNRTNVRADSDVDICVCCMDVFHDDYSMGPDIDPSTLGIVRSAYTHAAFKDAVGRALIAYFGARDVRPGNKAFDVHANTYRVDADVVAALEYRRYERDRVNRIFYHSGTSIRPDSGMRIINYPQQSYDNGVAKNQQSQMRFKGIVRIMKRLRNEMVEQGVAAAAPMASFLLECLVFNTPTNVLSFGGYLDATKGTLAHLYEATDAEASCSNWGEVNELKYLFRTSQPWRREQVSAFCVAAWAYLERAADHA